MTLLARNLAIVVAVAGFTAAMPRADAQTYPSRTVHLVVAYAAGGTGARDRKSVV